MVITGKGKRFNELEKAYICKYFEHDGKESLAVSLKRDNQVIFNLHHKLKNKGLIEHYVDKWDEFMMEGLE